MMVIKIKAINIYSIIMTPSTTEGISMYRNKAKEALTVDIKRNF